MTNQLASILVPVVILIALLGAAGTFFLFSSGDDEARQTTGLQESLLRLKDLPTGYTIGDDGGCGFMTPEGRPPALDRLLGMTFPPICSIELQRPGDEEPNQIYSAAVELPSVDIAEAVFALLPELGRRVIGSAETLKPEPYDFEDEAAIMEFREVNTQAEGIVFAWRSGNRINLIRLSGDAKPDILTYARKLAEIQQERAGNPVRLSAADMDDRAVPLDRSDLGVPVYWLDIEYRGPSPFPILELENASGPLARGESPGNSVTIDYQLKVPRPGRPGGGIELGIWQKKAWDTFLRTELGDLATAAPCGEPKVIQLADRRIEIHSPGASTPSPRATLVAPVLPPGQQPPPDDGNPIDTVTDACPPNHVGHVYFDDGVVVINLPNCFACGGPGSEYDSLQGIEALGRALRRR